VLDPDPELPCEPDVLCALTLKAKKAPRTPMETVFFIFFNFLLSTISAVLV
jgi:hypothetical protein